ncbi:MAG: class I SAM-dependent methyltransferase family protein [Candidatus Bathyarchaeota archaeon]|nr:class I SAM-dependent methyltransferase family protein [Candidatus Termiticorpusculum sp.]MCL1971240.1 class I SAM-dependent methyltransferase family protein [Candidatus Termiticorpusculum sp.]
MLNSIYLKVPKNLGEKIITLAHKLEIVNKNLYITNQLYHLYIPLLRAPNENEISQLKDITPDITMDTKDFTEKRPTEETLTEALKKQLPPNLHSSIPHSFDIIGDIAVVEIPPELNTYNDIIGYAILKAHKNIKSVHAKAGAISGIYRIRDLTYIAGENRTKTIYNEYNCQYHIDLAKAYFSPRLSQEHHRVATLVNPEEIVADLFAGVGPFAIPIGKLHPKTQVHAIDINPDAVELLKINVKVNKVENQVHPLIGDARELVNDKLCGIADRVIMNLPEIAIDFVDTACQTLKSSGGIIHFYGFTRKPDTIDDLKTRFTRLVEQQGRKITTFHCIRRVRETAPYEQQVVIDAQIH